MLNKPTCFTMLCSFLFSMYLVSVPLSRELSLEPSESLLSGNNIKIVDTFMGKKKGSTFDLCKINDSINFN